MRYGIHDGRRHEGRARPEVLFRYRHPRADANRVLNGGTCATEREKTAVNRKRLHSVCVCARACVCDTKKKEKASPMP